MLFDFQVLYAAGQALLAGQSPYGVEYFFYPLPAAYFFALWALLPYPISLALWWLASAVVLVVVARRAAWMWFLFPPVIANFLTGQVDLFILGLWALALRGSAAALALVTLKPQLGLVIVPYMLWRWRYERQRLAIFCATVVLIYGLPTAVWPGWIGEWLRHTRPLDYAMSVAPTLFGMYSLGSWTLPLVVLLAVFILWLVWKRGSDAVNCAGLLVNPVIHPYDFALMVGPAWRWRTLLAGWIGWLVFLVTGDARYYVIVPIVGLWEVLRFQADSARRAQPSGAPVSPNAA